MVRTVNFKILELTLTEKHFMIKLHSVNLFSWGALSSYTKPIKLHFTFFSHILISSVCSLDWPWFSVICKFLMFTILINFWSCNIFRSLQFGHVPRSIIFSVILTILFSGVSILSQQGADNPCDEIEWTRNRRSNTN